MQFMKPSLMMPFRTRESLIMRNVCCGLFVLKAMLALAAGADDNQFLPSVPQGYFLQAYDDCGVMGRQPHVRNQACCLFSPDAVQADERARSVSFGAPNFEVAFDQLADGVPYVLAVTYASEKGNPRIQSLLAGAVTMHGKHRLPDGKAERLFFKLPTQAIEKGKLTLHFILNQGPNAVVSEVGLWAPLPSPEKLNIEVTPLLSGRVRGVVSDLAYDGVPDVRISLAAPGGKQVITKQTDAAGGFSFSRAEMDALAVGGEVILSADQGERQTRTSIRTADLFFEPVHYRPMPESTAGLKKNSLSLDGAWRLKAAPGEDIRTRPLTDPHWATFKVPGQWRQQGFDIPKEQPVALATEFTIPKKWAAYRIFLRFDAIHGGTHFWLNGKPLGYCENLFTPVEWEITDAARPGQTNRLDLQMAVATASERLSYSSDYTGHSLGGVDRAVRIYALPKLQISSLHMDAGLDPAYRNGLLWVDLGVDNPDQMDQRKVEARLRLYNSAGKEVKHSVPKVKLGQVHPGLNSVSLQSRVANPLKWNAEQPNLYLLVIELASDGRMLERIERHVGFRKIEIKGRQLYVNGARVKLAGVCHHEIDPLTGRADTMRHAEEDVKLFKSANINDVRTSHYPPTQEFLDAADRYGLYVESEAPLCWVAPAQGLADLKAVLTPTSAMIDYNHAHPSIIIWSLANESHWSELFENSAQLCQQLDPSRPTTFNHAFSSEAKVTCDIMNRHYQQMPFDQILKNDPRPFMHGECFFLVYHERTDVAINPGLRELWAAGSADPASDWGKACTANFTSGAGLLPGIYPGAWSYVYKSDRVIGSEIWSGVDDITIRPDGKVESCENGNAYWGLIDGWRRPKPELELARFVFSPVWFPVRQLDYKPGQPSIRVPVENRHSFTDLGEFDFAWELNGAKGKVRHSVPPGSTGEIEIPIPKGTHEGATMLIRAINRGTEIGNATLSLGKPEPIRLSRPQSGAPQWSDNGKTILIKGKRFSLVLDQTTGDFDPTNPDHHAPIARFPALHVSRHDYGDLDRKKPPYAEFPNAKTRVVESVTAAQSGDALELIVRDHYEHFAGSVHWLIDNDGVGSVSYDYTYSGEALDSREIGIKTLLGSKYDEVQWRCWSEWGVFPKDSICRTDGSAKARRDRKWPDVPPNIKPGWPWSQDQTELGTADFRSIKFNIYEASLTAPDHSGVRVDANADAHFRACLTKDGVAMHILAQCPLAPVVLSKGDRLAGKFALRLIGNQGSRS